MASDYDERAGNALKDGYTRLSRRPRGAPPGDIVTEETADARERMGNLILEYGDYARSSWATNESMRRSRK